QLEALRSAAGPPAVVGRCAALLSHSAGQASPEAFREALTELLAAHGDNAATRLELAGSFWRAFEYNKVMEQIEAAQKLGPIPVDGEALLAYTLSRQLRYDECRAVYERLVARHPNRESWIVNGVHDGYYHLLRIEQDYEKAAAVLEAAPAAVWF
ncbi:MAG: hypothetical protein IH987_17480, partial [Planctomycetes bacterium]|nr:hypothetical protein [Planctomycetota bacterium]